MANTIKIKRGLKTNLPTLAVGEMGYCTDTNELFIGTAEGNELINEDSTINELGDIGDITITTPTADQALIYDGTNWVNDSPPAPSLPNQASISDATDTGEVTTTHLIQVNASKDSQANGQMSQVNASIDSFAINDAAYQSSTQVNGSQYSTAIGTCAMVTGSQYSTASVQAHVITSYKSKSSANRATIISGVSIENDESNSVAGGFNSTYGDPSTVNRKWHIFGNTGNIQIAGTLSSNVNFSDFAELFPNVTGKEQGYGLLQTLDGYGVRPAQEGERVFGVVSATAGILLNDTSFNWQGRYLVDEFGAKVMETIKDPDYKLESEATEKEIPLIEVQKENPEYDIDREQISRKDRPDEWTVVGLTGQVYVRLNKDVKVGDSVKAWKDGIGQTSEIDTNIVVMKITKPYDDSKGYAIGFCLIK